MPTGNGLAMRGAAVLRALAETHAVSLLVVRLYAPYDAPVPPDIARLCRRVAVVPAGAGRLGPAVVLRALLAGGGPAAAAVLAAEAARAFRDVPFDVVHVFRLAMLPYARPYLERSPRPRAHLDLDDVESLSRRRIAALHRAEGDPGAAAEEEAAADGAEAREAEALRDLDRVYVCSEPDRMRLLGRGAAEVRVLPNAVAAVPGATPPPRREPFTLLFVGTLGYHPNADGLLWFCARVLPLLRDRGPAPVRLLVVGAGAPPAVQALAALPGVTLVGAVPDVAPLYRDSHAVVVPIRAGGGTRIKVLEAFAHRRPVVSTTVGAEGIRARSGEHLLLGDRPEEFAAACRALMADAGLGARLAEAALHLVSARHSPAAMARVVAAAPPPPPPPPPSGSRAAGAPPAPT